MKTQKNDDIEVPDDLKVEFGSKEQKAWTDAKKTWEEAILSNKREIKVNKALIALAEVEIALEKEKFK